MTVHIGTKAIKATPMTRQEYNNYRGWQLPDDEAHLADEPGCLVECMDGGKVNDSRHAGYISWLPLDVFEDSYKASGSLSFGHAIELMKKGYKVARNGWNDKGMFLFLVDGSTFQVNRKPLLGIYPEGTTINYNPHVDMRTADGSIVPWLCSQTDMLANDWCIVE